MKYKILTIMLLIINCQLSIINSNAQGFKHPGGLVTQEDIDRIKNLKDVVKDATIVSAFNKLQANSHAKSTYNANAQIRVDRGGTDYADNYSIAMNDVAAAYQNALMWRITGNTTHADCAVRILNAWARTCKEITGDTNASLASGIYGYEFAQAGELLRGYSGWKAADFKAYQDWMRNLWYPRALYFLAFKHGRNCGHGDPGHYFSNWGLCNVLAVMSIGILCDDVFIYNQGLSFYKDDKCGKFIDPPGNPIKNIGYSEFLGNLVLCLHSDNRGPFGYLGQMQESGRDQGHATMAAALAVDICQTAWNQGDDLYSYMNNRIAAGFEYIALVNSCANDEEVTAAKIPFTPYDRAGMPTENYTATANNTTGLGSVRPCWDRVIAYYEGIKGVTMTYSQKMKTKTGIDGGGGDYGTNSGGFDHLGFSTLTNYRPSSMYPAAGQTPLTLSTSITCDGKTIQDNRLSGVTPGKTVTLKPTLPTGVSENGTWKWETGETTRELAFTAANSGIYRVTYTDANGVKSTQLFSIDVYGDCTPDILSYSITVGGTSYNDTVIALKPIQSFTLSINTNIYGGRTNTAERGTAKWSNGSTGLSLTSSSGINRDSVIWVEHTGDGGYKTRINFHLKLTYITPSVSIDGATATATNRAVITAGQSVELKPVTTLGYDNGTFLWSTGETTKNLSVANVQEAKHYRVSYTLTKNNVTTTDILDFYISIKRDNYQMPNGDYFIRKATDGAALTNPNDNATTKAKPYFTDANEADASQIWTITKETATNANGRYKIVSKKDGNYVNENGAFGTNAYYSDWNTYTFYALEGEDLYAIQNGGSAGTNFWTINSDQITKGGATHDGYPFLIIPVDRITDIDNPIFAANDIPKIYPNPAGEYVIVETEKASEFTLYTLNGSAVKLVSFLAGNNRIDIAGLPRGMYIGTLKNANKEINHFKIIKK
jgi:hypothetical protein